MLLKYKNIIIVLVIAAAGFFVYNYFFSKNTSTDIISSNSKSEAATFSDQIVKDIQRMKNINLNKEQIFENRVFLSLEDKGVKIEPQEAGRSNPFAPLSVKEIDFVTSASSSTTTKSINDNLKAVTGN